MSYSNQPPRRNPLVEKFRSKLSQLQAAHNARQLIRLLTELASDYEQSYAADITEVIANEVQLVCCIYVFPSA